MGNTDGTDPGVYRKFEVKRTDGSSEPGGKHENCAYFVLDLNHDPHALAALKAYASACRKTHPKLADDIEKIVATRPCGCRSAGECPHAWPWNPRTPSEQLQHLMSRAKEPGA